MEAILVLEAIVDFVLVIEVILDGVATSFVAVFKIRVMFKIF
jgi:hypothetical protein